MKCWKSHSQNTSDWIGPLLSYEVDPFLHPSTPQLPWHSRPPRRCLWAKYVPKASSTSHQWKFSDHVEHPPQVAERWKVVGEQTTKFKIGEELVVIQWDKHTSIDLDPLSINCSLETQSVDEPVYVLCQSRNIVNRMSHLIFPLLPGCHIFQTMSNCSVWSFIMSGLKAILLMAYEILHQLRCIEIKPGRCRISSIKSGRTGIATLKGFWSCIFTGHFPKRLSLHICQLVPTKREADKKTCGVYCQQTKTVAKGISWKWMMPNRAGVLGLCRDKWCFKLWSLKSEVLLY